MLFCYEYLIIVIIDLYVKLDLKNLFKVNVTITSLVNATVTNTLLLFKSIFSLILFVNLHQHYPT